MIPVYEEKLGRVDILLEKLSLFQVILAWTRIRRSGLIMLFDPFTIEAAKAEGRQERLSRWLLGRIKDTKLVQFDRQMRNRLGYLNNHASDLYVETVMAFVRQMPSYRIMRKIVAHEAIDRIYCRLLLPKISLKSQFYRLAEYLLKRQGKITLIPQGDDPYKIASHFDLKGALIPVSFRVMNVICGRLERLFTALFFNWVVWPTVFALHIIRSFRRNPSRDPLRVPVVMPMVYGFPAEDGLVYFSNGRKNNGWSDASLLNGELNSHNVAFFYDLWKFDKKQRIIQQRLMADRGIRLFDPGAFSANSIHRLEVWNLMKVLTGSLFQEPGIFIEPHEIVRASGRILHYLLRELLFNHNVDYRVRVEWGDYYPMSIMRTIVANRFGRSTIGVHHSANGLTYIFPQIRYLFLNRLCTWHEGFQKAFARHWNGVECVPIGNHHLDLVLEAMLPERLEGLRIRASRRWKISGCIMLVTLPEYPVGVDYQDPERFPELYQGILRCLQEIPGLWVVLRARSSRGWKDYLREPLVQKIATHPQVISDYEEFSTYEWIALADVVVGNSASSVVVEAGAAGKKCFSFDTMGLGEIIFGKYGSGFVLTKSEDLVYSVKAVLYKTPPLDCKWEEFAHDMTHFADGKNLKRFRDAIRGLADKTA